MNVWGWYMTAGRAARHSLHARSPDRPPTTTAAIARATTCSATRSSPSTRRPASTSGTSRRCITISGIPTCRRRRRWWTSSRTAGRFPRWRRSARPATCSSSIASTASRSSASRSGRCRKATCRANGIRRRSRSRSSRRRSTRVEFKKEAIWCGAEDTSPEHVAGVPGTVGQERRVLQRRAVHAVHVSTRTARRRSRRFSSRAAPAASTGAAPAADPTTGYVFVNAHDTSLVGWIEKKQPGKNYGREHRGIDSALRSRQRQRPRSVLHIQRTDEGRRPAGCVGNLPCQRPPWARLVAVNANTGDIAWQSAARPDRGAAGRQAQHRQQRQRRADRNGRRPGLRRRDQRSPHPGIRQPGPGRNCGWRRYPASGMPTR